MHKLGEEDEQPPPWRGLSLLLVLPEFPPGFGGMQTHAIELAQALHERGHDVRILTYQTVRGRDHEPARAFDEGLDFPVVRSLSRLGFYHNLQEIEADIRARPIDLLYSSTVFYGLLAPRLGVPVVARSPGNDVLRPWMAYPLRWGSSLASQPWFERTIWRLFLALDYPQPLEAFFRDRRRRLMEASARQLTHVFANSEFTEDLLARSGVGAEKVERLVGGVDHSHFGNHDRAAAREELGLPGDRLILLTACRLVYKKAVDFLIRSMPAILDQHPEAQLVIVGDGARRRKLQRLARQTGVSERITFSGPIAQPDMARLYPAADVFVLASRLQTDPISGQQDAETMGRVLCEANAAGVPVVAARSGGIPSVIEHGENGLLFEPDHEPGLLAALREITSDPLSTAALVEAGLRRAREEFDWSHIVDVHEDRFLQLAAEPSPTRPA